MHRGSGGLLLRLALLAAALAGSARAHAHGDLHDQIDAVSARLREHPNDAALFHKRGELHRAHGEHAAALADYARAERLDPGLTVVHLSRGRTLLEAGRAARAVASLSRFLAAQPDHEQALLLRARAQTKLGRRIPAEHDFAALFARVADPIPDLFLERAANLAAGGRREHALSVVEEGLRRLGSLVVLEDAALELEQTLGRFDAAIARIDRLLATAARKESLLARKAEILDRSGNAAKAAETRRAALAALTALPQSKRQVPAMQKLARELRAEGR
jgi:tetratricopeptide (TPR) repeat protein